MVNYARWTIVLTLLVCLFGVLYAAPNFFREIEDGALPGWVPQERMNLGLDLQGGSHLLVEVEVDDVITESLETIASTVRQVIREARGTGSRIGYTGLRVEGTAVIFKLRDPANGDRVRTALEDEIDPNLTIQVADDGTVTISMSEQAVIDRRDSAVEQSIEIIRRRVDETGVSEPTIQRQGDIRVLVQLPGLDDPERLKRLLGRTAKLTFHMVDSSVSFEDAQRGNIPAGSRTLPERDTPGSSVVVRRQVELSGERLTNAQPSFQDGQPIVSFTFDTFGARVFGDLTQQNVGERLAIVLDNEVISAPRIQSPILGGSGIITGQFTVQGVQDLSLLLRAGALPAPLSILEERTVGPGLGADSIAAGKIAAIIGLVLVIIFMAISYGLFGLMADVALAMNIVLIVAALSVLQATLTLPGIAGIVLTIGMAVDANVLIFERIREEVRNGRTPISAVDAGYKRALTTIIDANLTTLIASILLFQFGTGPIRGFAVTLSIGVVSSMFTAIMVTRLLVVLWLKRTKPDTLTV